MKVLQEQFRDLNQEQEIERIDQKQNPDLAGIQILPTLQIVARPAEVVEIHLTDQIVRVADRQEVCPEVQVDLQVTCLEAPVVQVAVLLVDLQDLEERGNTISENKLK